MSFCDYKVVSTVINLDRQADDELLTERVKEQMKDGWEPLGGVAVRIGQLSGHYLLQAMVKKGGSVDAPSN